MGHYCLRQTTFRLVIPPEQVATPSRAYNLGVHLGTRFSATKDLMPVFRASLWCCLRHPRQQLVAFDATAPTLPNLPYLTWGLLTGIAVIGSCIYGASLSLVFPQWRPTAGALWLAMSAGLGWCVFGPTLVMVTCRNAFTLAHACLVTMAYGEAVLVVGAALNLLLRVTNLMAAVPPGPFNLTWVALSNVVMATVLTLQLHAIQVPRWKTLLTWMVALNGSGALFFWWFQRLL
jgi:hypothetical protein